jgi:glycosyltransferase involved in cell wall biosynthesis
VNPLHIAHVTVTFPPEQTGTGNVCYHNALELARRGHQVEIFTAAHPTAPAEEHLDGLLVHRLTPWLRTGNAPLLPQLARRLAGFDLIHLHYPFFGGEGAVLAARTRRIPLVITYHQDVLLRGLPGLLERILRPTTSRWMLRSAGRLLFTSLDYAQASHACPLLRGRQQAIAALPNGVDCDHFTPAGPPPALWRQHHPAKDDFVLLLVAALDRAHYFKGVELLLETLAGLEPSFRAIIIGAGDLRPHYQQRASQLGLDSRVSFPGRVSQAELPDYYRLADCTVLPSTTMGEAFGLVLVESLACATPAIASSLPGVRTVIEAGVDGFLVTPGSQPELRQAILRLAGLPPGQRRALGAAGRAKVQARYAWPQIALQLESYYHALLAEHPA